MSLKMIANHNLYNTQPTSERWREEISILKHPKRSWSEAQALGKEKHWRNRDWKEKQQKWKRKLLDNCFKSHESIVPSWMKFFCSSLFFLLHLISDRFVVDWDGTTNRLFFSIYVYVLNDHFFRWIHSCERRNTIIFHSTLTIHELCVAPSTHVSKFHSTIISCKRRFWW